MKLYIYLSILFAFSCKADSSATPSSANSIFKLPTASGASGKEPEVIMGGPTNIKITLTDYPSSGTAKIIGFYSDQNYLADTFLFSNGILEYKNPKGLAQGMYYIGLSNRNEYIQLIFGKDQEFEAKLALSDIMNSIQVTGSDENQIMYDNMKYETSLSPRLTDLGNKLRTLQQNSPEHAAVKKERDALEAERLNTIKQLHSKNPDLLYTNYKLGGQNPKLREDLPEAEQVNAFKREFWNNVNFSDPRLLRTPMIGNRMKRFMKEITAQNPDSIISSANIMMRYVLDKPEYFKVFANWVVLTYEPGKSPVMDSENIFVNMVRNYFTKEKAYWASDLETTTIQQRATEMSLSLLGKKGPNVVSKDQYGKQQDIYSKKADYIVVYMYNPDCEHCQEQSPKLVQYYNQNKAEVDVFAIAIDTDDAKWKAYIQKTGMNFTNVYDPTNRSIYGKYFVDVTPEIYVLNKERIIIGKNLKVDQIQIVIDRDKKSRQ